MEKQRSFALDLAKLMWFIAQYWPKEQEFFMAGQYDGFRPEEFEEIEFEKIQQPEHLVNWVFKKRT